MSTHGAGASVWVSNRKHRRTRNSLLDDGAGIRVWRGNRSKRIGSSVDIAKRYHGSSMTPPPALEVPGNTDTERKGNAPRMMLTVPKEAILKAEQKLKKAKEMKRKKRA